MATLNAMDLGPEQTAAALPYPRLVDCLRELLLDPAVQVPPRMVHRLHGGGSLFVMPASDSKWAMTKLITFVAHNPAQGLPAIQGDVAVFDLADGQRKAMLHGPTVTARRTAAVSVLAAQVLADKPQGPLLIVGAGVQGRSHLEAFAQCLGVRQVRVASRTGSSADALVAHARGMGLQAERVHDLPAALAECPWVITCTSAQEVAVRHTPRSDAMVMAVGAFTPQMVEWEASVVRHLSATGRVVVDTRDADHEAGDLLQAQLDVSSFATLGDVIQKGHGLHASSPSKGPIFFKSCGWAGWDLAAVRCWAQGADSSLMR